MNLNQFIGKSQLACMRDACRGDEGAYFQNMIANLKRTIAAMPKTYETDGQGDEATAVLHYFIGGSDWYISERDTDGHQHQAFGFACLNGDYENAELGYISILELIQNGVELDLYYKPETIGAIKAHYQKRYENREENAPNELEGWLFEGTCPAEGCPEGCYVELDGRCSHGYKSVVLNMGLI